jgi:lipopolysaccharide biosynthesis glycosyltransferase
MHKNLVYFILTYKTEYIPLFSMLLESICKYSCDKPNFDILIITHDVLVPMINEIKNLKKFRHDFMILPEPPDLYSALMLKANIFDYPKINNYNKVLFIDVDIIVQNDINRLFDEFKPKDGVMYAVHEQNGTHFHKFWSLMKYTNEDIKKFMERGIISFNVGTMMFAVTPKMKEHHTQLRKLMKNSRLIHFYEQGFYNHYFNKALASDTDYLQNKVVIFPISGTYYPHPTFVHFAGIGQYEMKTREMTKYLKVLSQKKHTELI